MITWPTIYLYFYLAQCKICNLNYLEKGILSVAWLMNVRSYKYYFIILRRLGI